MSSLQTRGRPETGQWPGMNLIEAVEWYFRDQRRLGRINSASSERSYRHALESHAEDVGNRDPRSTGRNDIKRTLERWPHPNTQRGAHSALTSFYDWCVEEGIRKDNPARAVRKAKKRPTTVYRLTRAECVALIDACQTDRERWLITLGLCAGLRNGELRGLKGEHFQHDGCIWVSADIAKGKRERWVPVLSEALDVVGQIRSSVKLDEYVLPARRPSNPPFNTRWREYPSRPSSHQAILRTVQEVAKRAGIAAHVYPHLLRHAYGDHIAQHAGLRIAQALMGHASPDTTASTYTSRPGLDELAGHLLGFSYRSQLPQVGYPPATPHQIPQEATTGIEPV